MFFLFSLWCPRYSPAVKMSDSEQKTHFETAEFGDFQASAEAVAASHIGGPEDLLDVVGRNWKGIAIVAGFLFIVTSYQGRIADLEGQVTSLVNVYEGLPEDKALAVGALKSVEEMRAGLTVVVEERVRHLIEMPGLMRGGNEVRRRVAELTEMSTQFERLWATEETALPDIYRVVGALDRVLGPQVEPVRKALNELAGVSDSDSTLASGAGQYLLALAIEAHGSQPGFGEAQRLDALRRANGRLSRSGVVETELIAAELDASNRAFLRGDRDGFVDGYQTWWPRWGSAWQTADSETTRWAVAKGMSESLAFPLWALSQPGESQRLSVAELENALGDSLAALIGRTYESLAQWRKRATDRAAQRIAGAELDLALSAYLGEAEIARQDRLVLWGQFQEATGRFQGVSLELASQTLNDAAARALAGAQQLATVLGESVKLGASESQRAVLGQLPELARQSLGLHSAAH